MVESLNKGETVWGSESLLSEARGFVPIGKGRFVERIIGRSFTIEDSQKARTFRVTVTGIEDGKVVADVSDMSQRSEDPAINRFTFDPKTQYNLVNTSVYISASHPHRNAITHKYRHPVIPRAVFVVHAPSNYLITKMAVPPTQG